MLHIVGGLERTLTDKANYLVQKNHEIMLLTYKQGDETIYYDVDPRVIQKDINCPIHTLYKVPFYRRLAEYNNLRNRFRIRLKDTINNFYPDVIVVTIPYSEEFIYDIIRVAPPVKVIIESHLSSAYDAKGKSFTECLLSKLYPLKNAVQKADLLIALTEHDARYWHKCHMSRVKVVPNPITHYPESLDHKEIVKKRIIAVGRYSVQKSFNRLIDAFSLLAPKFPEWSVDIFGEGPLRDKMQQQIDRLGQTERIHLLPPTHEIYSEYQQSQFFVLSSDFEGFGLVIVEAMACGIPVVATDCPYGPSEIIDDGETGLLAKMSVKDLAEKMEWMIMHDEERKVMGMRAYRAVARYRKEIVMPKWEKTYLSVIR